MTGVSTSAVATRSDRRFALRDAIVIAALLIVAVVPVGSQIAGRPPLLDPAARVQSGWEVQSRRAFTRGELPVWNTYQFGGRPHLADPYTQALYPPHVMLRFLPEHLLFPVSFMLHAWAAGLGAYVVARHLGLTRPAAFAGSVGVMLSGIITPAPDLAHVPSAYTLAWLPAVVAFTLRSIDAPRPFTILGLAAAIVMGAMTSPRGPMYVLSAVVALYLMAMFWPSTTVHERRRLAGRCAAILGLAAGLGAFQFVPTATLRASMADVGGSRWDPVFQGSWHPGGARRFEVQKPLADTLRSLRRGRVLAGCDSAIDASQLLGLGVPAIGGWGGVYAADYARFVSLALGGYAEKPAEYSGVSSAGNHPARPDLLALLNAGYLVSCNAPDPTRWQLLDRVGGVGVYRSVHTLPFAFWTCAPVQVGREELEYRLRRNRYDQTLTLTPRGPLINVRWAPGIDEEARARMEATLHIAPERFVGDRTWEYEVLDPSPANIASIVSSAAVEDTSGIDRGTLVMAAPPEPLFNEESKNEWLLGTERCEALRPANVLGNDADGEVALAVDAPRDGIVFVSETFYPTRRAWVDGRRVEPLNVNLAFIGVPVSAGIHRIGLQHDNRPFWVGAGVSAVTVVAWLLWMWRERSRR